MHPQDPLSEPTPVRAERTYLCTNPSMVPVSGVAPPLPPYERGALLLDHTGVNFVERPAGLSPAKRSVWYQISAALLLTGSRV